MEVIRRIQGEQSRPIVCRDLNITLSTVTTITKNANTIKETIETAKKKTATTLRYPHRPCEWKKESCSHCGLMSQMKEIFHSHKLLLAYIFILQNVI
jgi:hypothetical protein